MQAAILHPSFKLISVCNRISKVPADPAAVFIETVVIHPETRGKGVGRRLMLLVEKYCLDMGLDVAYLTTHDQQVKFRNNSFL